MNKKKIFNDPVYGLISFQHEILYSIIDHPYFQRLRRISQQALSHYVYPGALHTRFQHALGALHLMTKALDTLRSKGIEISSEEYEAACIAILSHDVGHGPYSHALEHILLDIHHEELSLIIMNIIGDELKADFSLAIKIFKNEYHRPFLYELVAGQLDMDRLDYLNRDSYFSGVAEGNIGYDRIITMLHVKDNKLVVEEKGIYSVEMYLMARKTMYLQVYFHKTVVAAEFMLISILKRCKYLVQHHIQVPCSPALHYFLKYDKNIETPLDSTALIQHFILLDDTDILWTIKNAVDHEDKILSLLCTNIISRKLFKVHVSTEEIKSNRIAEARNNIIEHLGIQPELSEYFMKVSKEIIPVYNSSLGEIRILQKNGRVRKFSKLLPRYDNYSELLHFLVYLKN